MSTCNHGNTAPDHILNALHESQAGPQRHKCTECAFQQGRALGETQAILPGGNAVCEHVQRRAPQELIDALPESQAGPGRHKCAVCAFHEGFTYGKAIGNRE